VSFLAVQLAEATEEDFGPREFGLGVWLRSWRTDLPSTGRADCLPRCRRSCADPGKRGMQAGQSVPRKKPPPSSRSLGRLRNASWPKSTGLHPSSQRQGGRGRPQARREGADDLGQVPADAEVSQRRHPRELRCPDFDRRQIRHQSQQDLHRRRDYCNDWSFNFSKAAESSNAENVLVLTNAKLAKTYTHNWTA
jgi:hypothetical protein